MERLVGNFAEPDMSGMASNLYNEEQANPYSDVQDQYQEEPGNPYNEEPGNPYEEGSGNPYNEEQANLYNEDPGDQYNEEPTNNYQEEQENVFNGEVKQQDNSQVEADEKRWPGWPGESVFRVLVPAQKVGAIIGRKGEFIKRMCEESRARIKILDGPPGVPERAVSISAKSAIEDKFVFSSTLNNN